MSELACHNCKHKVKSFGEEPCKTCSQVGGIFENWEPVQLDRPATLLSGDPVDSPSLADRTRQCATCEHVGVAALHEPCNNCYKDASRPHWTRSKPVAAPAAPPPAPADMPAAPPTRGEARIAPEHQLWKDGDADIPEVILDRSGRVALDLCKVCGRGEAELLDQPACLPRKLFVPVIDGSKDGFGRAPVTLSAIESITEQPAIPGITVTEIPVPPTTSAADILDEMARTFRERNRVYGSNYKMVAPMMRTLFPNGVPPELVVADKFHLFELLLVKLSRFAISGLTHKDSIHDAGVYAAMLEHCLKEEVDGGIAV